jgi:hypothetical protein
VKKKVRTRIRSGEGKMTENSLGGVGEATETVEARTLFCQLSLAGLGLGCP